MNRDGLVGDDVGHVAGFRHRLLVLEQVGPAGAVGVLVVVDVAALEAEEEVVAVRVGAVLGLVAEVPLAEERRGVAGVLQQLRQRAAGGGQPLFRGGGDAAERRLDREALLIAPGDESGPGRAAHRAVGVEVGQLHAVSRQAVDVRRLDVLRPVAADVGVADVVGDDEHHVRPRSGGRRLRRERRDPERCRNGGDGKPSVITNAQ